MNRHAGAVFISLFLGGCASAPPPMPEGAVEWRWEGRHRIDSFLEIPEGVTLVLLPGTVLEFAYRDIDGDGYGDNGLHVKGSIVAVGREGAPVVFTSAREQPVAGRLGRTAPGQLPGEQLRILHHRVRPPRPPHPFLLGFHPPQPHREQHRGDASRRLPHRDRLLSLIAGNISKGLNFRACANGIRRNTITGNGHGIFLFETDTATVIEENNIHGNEGYDFRLGDFYEGGFELRGNWWGTADEEAVRRRIFEGDDPRPAGEGADLAGRRPPGRRGGSGGDEANDLHAPEWGRRLGGGPLPDLPLRSSRWSSSW